MKSFLQTTQWADFQRSTGNAVWRYPSADSGQVDADGISAFIVQSRLPFGKNYLYIPYGPDINFDALAGGIRNSVGKFFAYLKNLAARERSIFIRIEPMSDAVAEVLYPHGLKKSSRNIQPHRTLVIDVDKDEHELLGAMHHKTRYNIKVAERHGVIVRPSRDVGMFLKLMRATVKRDAFHPQHLEYYEKLLDTFQNGAIKTELFLAFFQEHPVAGAIVLTHGDTAYYLHGVSDYERRSLMAPHLLHREIMKRLRASGVKFYDLWGIDSTRWPGVTRFKLGFGGRVVEYPGAFDLPISKFWYFVYNVARKIR